METDEQEALLASEVERSPLWARSVELVEQVVDGYVESGLTLEQALLEVAYHSTHVSLELLVHGANSAALDAILGTEDGQE